MKEREVKDASITNAKEGKYLTFSLDGEEYGIGILKVKEIIGMMWSLTQLERPHYLHA